MASSPMHSICGDQEADGPGLGVVCADFNSDGWIDIYVANDGAANLLWINKGNGTFEETGADVRSRL